MKCKKCGCDTLIKTDDWYKCANCGAEFFDREVSINVGKSPTMEIEELEKKQALQDDENQQELTLENQLEEQPAKEKKSIFKQKKKSKEQPANQEKKPEKSKVKETVDFMIPIVFAIVLAMILKTFVFANAVVPTGSMLNTIQKGDRIIASRLSYISSDPERYDIVIFKYPDQAIDPSTSNQKDTVYYVKRVIGLPGETVEVIDGKVYVTKTDGEVILLDDEFVTNCIPEGDYGPFEVPEDCYFMMGDNRNDSYDSRFWVNKYVNREDILGKVKFKYYPGISSIE